MTHLFVYGPPGSGKSTVGRELAALLGLPFVDLDADIAQAAGRSIAELMAEGEETFRDLESAALLRALERSASVIALGGGALLREANRRCAEEHGYVVCLDADYETLVARLAQDDTPRPLLAEHPPTRLANLLAERREHYRSFTTRLDPSDRGEHRGHQSPEAVAREILRRLNRLRVRTPDGWTYDVAVRPNGLGALGSMMRERHLDGPVVVVADDTVAPLYGAAAIASLRRAGYEAHLSIFPAGERSKTVETVATLWQAMLGAGLERSSCVVALGGGVTGDLAGFAAATFMRGIDWVGVPTTLLAMVDASVGGKTGVDLPDGKNLAGCFHHPRLVLVDPDVLETLPDRDLRAGMAEVVKHGIIGDPALFSAVEQGWERCRRDLVGIIGRALAVKIRIVEQDPLERGLRAALNLGHTIGHAVEVASGYALLHGEAVAIGLVAETALAEKSSVAEPGLTRRIGLTLHTLGLPVTIPRDVPLEAVVRAMGADKKKSAGTVRFTLPAAIGEVSTGIEVRDVRAALEACATPAIIERLGIGSSATAHAPTVDRRGRGESA
jgi:shikimate kinase/3-dehydroquinate synthase